MAEVWPEATLNMCGHSSRQLDQGNQELAELGVSIKTHTV